MNVLTCQLVGAALDWAVAKCEGLPIRHDPMGFGEQSPGGYWIWEEGFPTTMPYMQIGRTYSPSRSWSQGGPLMEKGKLVISPDTGKGWSARSFMDAVEHYGETPLIAAMRCYVADNLGAEVDIPEGLA